MKTKEFKSGPLTVDQIGSLLLAPYGKGRENIFLTLELRESLDGHPTYHQFILIIRLAEAPSLFYCEGSCIGNGAILHRLSHKTYDWDWGVHKKCEHLPGWSPRDHALLDAKVIAIGKIPLSTRPGNGTELFVYENGTLYPKESNK